VKLPSASLLLSRLSEFRILSLSNARLTDTVWARAYVLDAF
jgi:hypothetical protein